jgi:amidase
MDEPHFQSIADLGGALRRGAISASELTRHMLARIDRLDTRLHAYIHVFRDEALTQAQRADDELRRGIDRGPLQGIPVSVKDLLYTANAPTTAGSRCLGAVTPRWDATVVARLDAAGAVLLGKTVTTEGALSEHRPDRPAPVNPWNADYWTGVSSSGAGVATASGLCNAAVGTDTGGSIRMPSMACGLSGLKPTWGRVSRHGLFPLCESRDHVGPMARSVADAAAMMGAIAGPDPHDLTSLAEPPEDYLGSLNASIAGLRIGLDRQSIAEHADPEIGAALDEACATFEGLGARLVELTLPSPTAYLESYFASTVSEVALAHAPYFTDHVELYGPVLRHLIEAARGVGGMDVARVEHERLRYAGSLARLFSAVDVLLVPVLPNPTRTVAEMAALTDPASFIMTQGRFTLPFNATGNPALVVPCGIGADGMPIALQLAGRHLAEATLFRLGHAFQSVTAWHKRHPADARSHLYASVRDARLLESTSNNRLSQE